MPLYSFTLVQGQAEVLPASLEWAERDDSEPVGKEHMTRPRHDARIRNGRRGDH